MTKILVKSTSTADQKPAKENNPTRPAKAPTPKPAGKLAASTIAATAPIARQILPKKAKAPVKAKEVSKAAAKVMKAPAAKQTSTPTSKAPTKLAQVTMLLRDTKGASLADLMDVTGWQAHSVRGALSGAIKKKLGLKLTSARVDGERRYRIEA